jgi:protein-disulfide isomerase
MGRIFGSMIALAALGVLVQIGPVGAEETGKQPPGGVDEKELVERVKQAVLDELRRGGILGEEINKGIRAFIEEQRAAQQAALAEREKKTAELAKSVQRASAKRDHILGNSDAIVSLIEYSDFKCPYCKHFHSTANQVVASYDGKINWVYRYLPLSFHNPEAQKLAEASECAAEVGGNKAFWRFSDLLFERAPSGGQGFPLDQLAPLAKEIGLDEGAFRQCLDSGKKEARVQEDATEAARIGVTGTLGNILNNQTGEVKVLAGAVPAKTFKAAIDSLLAPTGK